MGRYVDWYLVELEGLIRDRMPAAAAHDLMTETETHLRQSSAELMARGMAEREAELAAIERFGKAGRIASAATGVYDLGKRSPLLPMAFLTATLIFFVAMVGRLSGGSWWSSAWFVASLFVAFAIASTVARRPLWTAILAWSIPAWLCTAVVFGFAFCGTGFDERNLVPGLMSSAREVVNQVDGELRTLDRRIDGIKNPPSNWTGTKGSKRFEIPLALDYVTRARYFSAPTVRYSETDDESMAKSFLPKAALLRAELVSERRMFESRANDYEREMGSSVLESMVTHLPAAALITAMVSGAALIWQLVLVGLFAIVGTNGSWYRRRYA